MHKYKERGAMKRHSLLYIQSFLAHGLGLLLVIILLIVAQDFVGERSALAALLVFAFSLSYLAAAVRSVQAYYLYGGMLLGAVAYFMACLSLGAPVQWFPPLSLPLVFCLWLVGRRLQQLLPPNHALFSATTFRAMNITVAAFAAQALWQIPNIIAPDQTSGSIAAMTLFGHALLYLLHAMTRRSRLYVCVFSVFVLTGTTIISLTFLSPEFLSFPLLFAAAALLLIATIEHKRAGLFLSRFYYASFGIALGLAITGILIQPVYGLYVLAIASALSFLGYLLLASVVRDVVCATSNERLTAKLLVCAGFLFAAPITPFLFLPGLRLYWIAPAMIAGAALSAHAWHRRADKRSSRNLYVYASVLFLTAAIIMKADISVTAFMAAFGIVAAHVLALQRTAVRKSYTASASALSEALAAPAFFVWYVPLMTGNSNVALAGALVGFAVPVLAFLITKQTGYISGAGAALAGVWIVAASPVSTALSMPFWVIVVGGAMLAGIVFGAGLSGRILEAGRMALGLAWLVLSALGPTAAYASGNGAEALLAATGMAAASIIVLGLIHDRKYAGGIFYSAAWILVLAGTGLLGCFGLASGLDAITVSFGFAYLAITAVAMGVWCRGLWLGRLGFILFAVAGISLSFLYTPALERFILHAAAVPFILFLLGVVLRKRDVTLADNAVATGHAASGTVVALLLLLSHALPVAPALVAAVASHAGLYLAGVIVYRSGSFRFGSLMWLVALATFAAGAYVNASYATQAFIVVLLAALLTGLGALCGGRGITSWASSLCLAAAYTAAAGAMLTLILPPVGEAWHVFLVAGLVFVALSLLLRQDIYAYMVTVCMAMMVYDWVRVSTTHFTQDVFYYPLIAAIVLAVLLLLPHFKQLANRLAALPVFNVFSIAGATLAIVPLMGGSAFFLSAYSLKVTAHPRFCTSCHYMDEYYDSWSHSSHADVACVECHYEPGLKSELLGKGDGLIQLIKYISHSYSNRPHGIISNKSCMRSGCHDDIADVGKMLLYDGKIRFRHDSHLSDHPRGQDLNCVSCHGQMVQGSHIAVTPSTCITCHFYGREEKSVAIGDCLSCHAVLDETVMIGNEVFDHPAFLADKATVDCAHCHSQVTQGTGEVSEVRCNTCHLGPHEPIEDIEEFHLIHAQIRQFDCLQCHDKIRHGVHPRDQQMLFSAADCAACHSGERHTIQKRVYAGTALPELDVAPDFMYVAGVTCDGCHTTTKMIRVGEMTLTGKVSTARECSACHADENYGEILVYWQEEIREEVEKIRSDIETLTAFCDGANAAPEEIEQALAHLAAAQSKVKIVEIDGSYGGHNYFYISDILSHAAGDVRTARTAIEAWDADKDDKEPGS